MTQQQTPQPPVSFDKAREIRELANFIANSTEQEIAEWYMSTRGILPEMTRAFQISFDKRERALVIKYYDDPSGAEMLRYIDIPQDATQEQKKAGAKPKYRMRGGEDGKLVYNVSCLDGAANSTDEYYSYIYITEGQIDSISVCQCGIWAVACKYPESLLDELAKRGGTEAFRNTTFVYLEDSDKQGKVYSRNVTDGLRKAGYAAYIYSFPSGVHDANDALLKGVLASHVSREAVGAFIAGENERERAEAEKYFADLSGAAALASLRERIDSGDYANVIPTGFDTVDRELDGGFGDGLIIVGAITSLGKTTFVQQICDQMAAAGYYSLFFSLEMSRDELAAKSISRLTASNGDYKLDPWGGHGDTRCQTINSYMKGRWKAGRDATASVEKAERAYLEFADKLIIIQCNRRPTPADIEAQVLKFRQLHQERFAVVVDYLQIMDADIAGTDKQKVDQNILELKQMSRNFRIPIILISSFNRDSKDKDTDTNAFKESGGIEYSADYLFALQLKGQGKDGFNATSAKAENPRKVELLILKNRRGRVRRDIGITFDYYPAFNLCLDNVMQTGRDDYAERLEEFQKAKERQRKATAEEKAAHRAHLEEMAKLKAETEKAKRDAERAKLAQMTGKEDD